MSEYGRAGWTVTQSFSSIQVLLEVERSPIQWDSRGMRRFLTATFIGLVGLGVLEAGVTDGPMSFFGGIPFNIFLVMGLISGNSVVPLRGRDWWLSYPVPRFVLVSTRALVALRRRVFFLIYVLAISVAVFCVMWVMHPNTWYPGELLSWHLFNMILLLFVLLPILVSFDVAALGLTTTVLSSLKPLIDMMVSVALVLLEVRLVGVHQGGHTNFSVGVATALALLLGWPLAYVLLWWTARRLPYLAVTRTAGKTRGTGSRVGIANEGITEDALEQKTSTELLQSQASRYTRTLPIGFLLFLLEMSRTRIMGKDADDRLKLFVWGLAVMGMLAGWSLGSTAVVLAANGTLVGMAWLSLLARLFSLSQWYGVLLEWRLCIPLSRVTLIMAGSIAWLVRTAIITVILEVALFVGVLAHGLAAGTVQATFVGTALSLLVRSGIIVAGSVSCLLFIMDTVSVAFARWNGRVVLLAFLCVISLFVVAAVASRWLVLAVPTAGMWNGHFWALVTCLYATSAILSVWFVRTGARNIATSDALFSVSKLHRS